MEKFRLIPLLTAAVMGCTALLAGCGKEATALHQGRGGRKDL
ncbi:MAG: hypothetical protein ACLTCP_06240 [Ruminococcus bicirculans (ex Wegman et al. 2014)]